MPTIDIGDLNKLSDEEVIAYATLLKSKKKPITSSMPFFPSPVGTPEFLVVPENSIEAEIEKKVIKTNEERIPVKTRFKMIMEELKNRDWLTLKELIGLGVPPGDTMMKIKKFLHKHNQILSMKKGRDTYFIYRDSREKEKLEMLNKGESKITLIEKKKNRDKSGFFAFKKKRLPELLKEEGMSKSKAFSTVAQEWLEHKKTQKAPPEDFPPILGVKKNFAEILMGLLDHVIKSKGVLRYNECSYTLGIENTHKWIEFLQDLYLKSDTICGLLDVSNKFKIVGNGKEMMLAYE